MVSDPLSRNYVVYSDNVELAALRRRHNIGIYQNERYADTLEYSGNFKIHLLISLVNQRPEDDAFHMAGGKFARKLPCLKSDRLCIANSRLSEKKGISGILAYPCYFARKRLEYRRRRRIRDKKPQQACCPLPEIGEKRAFTLSTHHKPLVLKLKNGPLHGLAPNPELPYKLRFAWQRASGILAGANVVLKRFCDNLVFRFIGHDVHGIQFYYKIANLI